MIFKRFALYFAPSETADWARFCTRWLGWDMAAGATVPHPELTALPRPVPDITETPRKYGLHATIKPPFRLAEGHDRDGLEAACAAFCNALAPVRLDGLHLTRMGRFLALCPVGDQTALNVLAATCVRHLDRFRAPPTTAELDHRRAANLSPDQETNLTRWGYPYVMDAFRFHITLTGRLPKSELSVVETALSAELNPLLPAPFVIDQLALVGEDDKGRFHLIHRYALSD